MSPRSSPTTRARAVGDLASLLRLRAELAPEQVAYRFLDGDGPPDEITYAQLMARAAALGARVASASRRGDRVMLMLPPGIDYVVGLFACLAAGRVAVPAYPPDRRRLAQSLQRLEAVCADASAALALAAPEALALLASSEAQLPCLAGLGRLEAAAPANDGAGAPLPDARPHDVAILHYTSGSTSAPKGVVLGHDNLLANLEHIRRAFEQTPETRAVFWLPPYHDMGLVGAILEPLYAGYPSVLMSPFDFVARPARWLEEIGRWRATTSGGPNFAYDLCVRKTTVEERERLDLSSWTLAFNGSEPVRAGTLTRFAAAFAPAGFRASAFLPCYGLAEATLLVASARVGERPRVHAVDRGALAAGRLEPGETQLVSSGHPVEGLVVAIADPASGTAVPDGTVGEIWVSAPSVARGYWRRPNDRAFESRLPVHPGRRFLRTGDLGAVVGGELVVAGREKDVIVVRGRNVHPHDVELAAERAHPAIRPGGTAAFAAADATEEDARITIVCEVEAARGPVDAEALGRAVRRSVAERCDVVIASVVLVAPGHVPKTSSGKVRRRACRSSLSSGALTPIAESRAHWRPREPPDGREIAAASGRERIALARELIVALAARRGAPAANGAQSLLDLVTDSVEAMELAADLQSALGVEVRLEQVLGPVPLDELAAHVAELVGAAAPRPSAADPGALSEGQEALWLLQRLAPASSAYHLSVALRLHGRLNAEALARALALLTARHSLLRARIAVRDGRPRVVEAAPPELVHIEPTGAHEAAALMRSLVQKPFDLERGPLWRCALLDGPAPVLVLCMHHVIGDYVSLQVMLADLERGLTLGSLPPPSHEHADLVAREAAATTGATAERNRAYWARELADLPVLALPSPSARPARPTQRGTQHEIAIPAGTVEALQRLARAEGTTLHAVLLAGLHALLHRWTGQEDIAIGTPVSTRRPPWAAGIVGYCTNPVPVRAQPVGDRPFVELLREVRDRVIAAVAHELPFPAVVRAAGAPRDPNRTPVFQALFALEKTGGGERDGVLGASPDGRVRFAEMDAEPLLVRPAHVPFDLAVVAEQTKLGVTAAVQVSHDALRGDCAARIADQWVRLLGDAVRRPSAPIGRLDLMGPDEQRFVVHEVNRTTAGGPARCLHELFAQQAKRTPDADALVDGHRAVSYGELLGRAAAIAHRLREEGIRPERRVGLHAARGADMIAAVLGILAAGGAYVYLDPGYPRERLEFVVGDADFALLLTQEALAGSAPSAPRTLVLERIAPTAGAAPGFPAGAVRPEQLAYVIYTSGSTGRPKGVAIEHRNAAALVDWAHAEYGEHELRGVLAGTSLAFDLSVFEIFAPLTRGGTAVLAESALELTRLPARDRLTLINTVPSVMTELLAAGTIPRGVRVVNLAGEPLTAALADAVLGLGHVERLYNLYGPTEDTTYSTFERVQRGATPTLGRSLAHRAAYILDRFGQPVPVGVDGEICLGGAGVARGYLNRPELTSERFVESRIPGVPGRLYRTGDVGRRLPDGRIEYRGRRDRQVKLRGFRIELDEVVSALLDDRQVRDAAVIADARQRLLAYVAAPDGADPDALRTSLRSRLPPFMVPNRITVLPRLPLTPNGKVDHAALQALARADRIEERVRPAGPVEAALAEIWRDVLGVEAGVEDDFFALGGHSLLAGQLQAQIRERLGVELPLAAVFERPTIRALAAGFADGPPGPAASAIRAAPRRAPAVAGREGSR